MKGRAEGKAALGGGKHTRAGIYAEADQRESEEKRKRDHLVLTVPLPVRTRVKWVYARQKQCLPDPETKATSEASPQGRR